MDFALDEFQTSLLTTAQRFAADRLAPAYRARESRGVIEPALIREMGQLGLIAPEVHRIAAARQRGKAASRLHVRIVALFAGVEGRAVAHNVFLDGNLLTTSPSVKKNVLVGDAVAGLEIFNRVGSRIAVSATYRSKEYATQVSPHIFGSLDASFKF